VLGFISLSVIDHEECKSALRIEFFVGLNEKMMFHLFKEMMESNKESNKELITLIAESNKESNKELITTLYDSNRELKQIILEQQAKMMELASKPTINNTNSNNNNKTNITVNMFLNEHCKDAMTINTFLKSINPSMDQLMYMTTRGNKEGLIQIMNDTLCSMKITERPIHCTDMNRIVTWVKQDEGWSKEYEQESMKRICLHINHACEKQIIKIVDDDPEYTIPRSEKHEQFLKMLIEANGGAGFKGHINAASAINTIKDKIFLGKDEIRNAI
jgi:hypothetical protein